MACTGTNCKFAPDWGSPGGTILRDKNHSQMKTKPVSQYGGIVWDWNGTLLDDTHLAVASMNNMLGKRGLPFLSVDHYKKVFTFPVKEYYREIGFEFDREPFEIPAMEFINYYNQKVHNCSLHENTIQVLNYFKIRGISQYILSAMQQDTLDQCLKNYRINQFFEHVSGLDDHYANSKLDTGRVLLGKLHLDPGELLMVGDTVHDFEVASELGCSCILVSNGHQSHERLMGTGARVIDNLLQLMN
jgi:phosphoglycolate phosphatase